MGSQLTNVRESLGSRLGFLLISAGCAIGLGNVWRFPFITGKYGGGAFVLLYLGFLIFLALPVMIMEFSMGRAAQCNIGGALKILQPPRGKWHLYGFFAIMGNYMLMMFYTVVTGWMLAYVYYTASGQLSGLSPDEVGAFFGGTLGSWQTQLGWMALVVIGGFAICAIGLRAGVERVTKFMMGGLFLLVLILAIRSLTLGDTGYGHSIDGLKFYLTPDFSKLSGNWWSTIFAAMGQAFFTLSVGIGSMLIFGSYINKEHSLTGESVRIMGMDLAIALLAGLIILPACFAFGQEPNSGPGLLFVTLPNIFNIMSGGIIWGTLFFIFMSFAALTTVIAVFENIVSFGIDILKLTRGESCFFNVILVLILAVPCALGFNAWASFAPLGPGTVVLDLEDFVVSENLLPFGSFIFVLFCCSRYGWGWNNFIKEADTGRGMKFPAFLRPYFTWILPLIVLVVLGGGYYERFFKEKAMAPAAQSEELQQDGAAAAQPPAPISLPAGELVTDGAPQADDFLVDEDEEVEGALTAGEEQQAVDPAN